MAASPRHASNIEDGSYLGRSSSPPMITKPLNWKTPSLQEKKRPRSPLLAEEESTSTDDILSTPFTWKRPVLASRTNHIRVIDSSTDTESEEVETLQYTKTHPRLSVIEQELASSSSSSTLDVDDGNYELESILLDEEECSIPAYNRHRSKTGIDALDEILVRESNDIVEEEIEAVGLACGSSLEITGPPASGKTTLLVQMGIVERLNSLQRCKDAIRRNHTADGEELDGANEAATQVVLIDTEGSIGLDCLAKIASKCVLDTNPSLSMTSKLRLLKMLLSGIHYYRCTSNYELLALLRTLLPMGRHTSSQVGSSQSFVFKEIMPSTTLPIRTSMILIDSISYHLRAPVTQDTNCVIRRQRNRLMEEIRLFCARCSQRGIKVIFCNQMKMTLLDKIGNKTDMDDKEAEGHLFPLFNEMKGGILGHSIWRVVLFRDGRQDVTKGDRFAHILSHPVRISESVKRGEDDKIDKRKRWMPVALHSGMLHSC